jgi:hypothetical protein
VTTQPKRVAVFLPKSTSFYLALFFALKRAFERQGIECGGWTELLGEEQLLEFCRQFKPDVIFEMNRARAELPRLPAAVKHVAWIVDTLGRPIDYFRDSDIVYFFGANWLRTFPRALARHADWLPPGACPDAYFPQSRDDQSDVTFVGHIPNPWSDTELQRVVCGTGENALRFDELYPRLLQHWSGVELKGFANDTYLQSACDLIERLVGKRVVLHDPVLRYDIGCRAVRMMNRHALLSSVIPHARSLRLYGPDNWTRWPQYAPYYRAFAHDPHELRAIYQSSKINLHEGVGPHFRAFDCMASGGVLFYLRSPDDDLPGGMNEVFEPHVHYVPFNRDDFAEQAREYLNDGHKRRRVARAAAELIGARHTWAHRVNKIVGDLAQI